jgi:hypothetical protein
MHWVADADLARRTGNLSATPSRLGVHLHRCGQCSRRPSISPEACSEVRIRFPHEENRDGIAPVWPDPRFGWAPFPSGPACDPARFRWSSFPIRCRCRAVWRRPSAVIPKVPFFSPKWRNPMRIIKRRRMGNRHMHAVRWGLGSGRHKEERATRGEAGFGASARRVIAD